MLKRTCMILAFVAVLLLSGAQRMAMAAPDAVSAASLQVTISQVTQTQVTVNYTFDERAGTRNFCYDVAPATPSTTCVVQTPRALTGTLTANNLKAGTTYNYALSAIDPTGRHKTSTTRGTFTTLKATPVALHPPKGQSSSPRYIPGTHIIPRDLLGRKRESISLPRNR
jgi:hypothetical protein